MESREISSHQAWEQLSQIDDCDGYSFALVANDSFFKSPLRDPARQFAWPAADFERTRTCLKWPSCQRH